jgi:hypothetical protein
VCPRYRWESPSLKNGPPAHYDRTQGPFFDAKRDRGLMHKIEAAIKRLLTAAEEQDE